MTRWRWALVVWTILLVLLFASTTGSGAAMSVLVLATIWLVGVLAIGAVRGVTRR